MLASSRIHTSGVFVLEFTVNKLLWDYSSSLIVRNPVQKKCCRAPGQVLGVTGLCVLAFSITPAAAMA